MTKCVLNIFNNPDEQSKVVSYEFSNITDIFNFLSESDNSRRLSSIIFSDQDGVKTKQIHIVPEVVTQK